MDNAELTKWRTLANDALIATFGNGSREQQLAEALERAVEELAFIADECDHCKYCYTHGGHEDDAPLTVDADDVVAIHGKLEKRMQALKDLHVKFAGAVTETEFEDLTDELATLVEETDIEVDELEALAIP